MKSFVREVRNSFYNPKFYRDVTTKSESHIFEYTTKLTFLITCIYLVLLLTVFRLNSSSLPDVSTAVFATGIVIGIIVPVVMFAAIVFLCLVVFSYAFGLVAFLTTIFLRYEVRYDSVRKMSIYAITPVVLLYVVLALLRQPPLSIYIGVLLAIGVFLLNYRKRKSDHV